MPTLKAIAHHEAGHAVIGWMRGATALMEISIVPDDVEGTLGHVRRRHMTAAKIRRIEAGEPRDARRLVEPLLQSFYAGVVAEKRLGGRPDWAGATRDTQEAARLVTAVTGSAREAKAYSDWQLIATEDAVGLWWTQIETLASVLLDHPTLRATEARKIVGTLFTAPSP
jgi:hypothetical protein